MNKFKISQQKDVIDSMMNHLKNGSMGLALAEDWNYHRENNTIYFSLKQGHKPKLDVILWFGYMTNN